MIHTMPLGSEWDIYLCMSSGDVTEGRDCRVHTVMT